LDTPSGTPKERSVMAAQLPEICSSCSQPFVPALALQDRLDR
jgi:hypothetical protein